MKQTMRLNQSQRLTMTPALQQAIRMLQLSTLDLKTEIQNALESNFMLEAEEPEPTPAEPAETDASGSTANEEIPDNLPVDADWRDIYTHTPAPGHTADDPSWRDYQQANLTEGENLHSHLAWQADMQPFTRLQRRAASHIIDAINNNGLIDDWPGTRDQLALEYDLQPHAIETILSIIQNFDPTGVGARDIAECLAIQLHQLDAAIDGRDVALRIVEDNHLDTLARDRPDALARQLDIPRERLETARTLLRTLQPHPGAIYSQSLPEYVNPEVLVVRQPSGWQVSLSPDIAPRLRINDHYLALMNGACGEQDRSTLKSHLQEARFFLNSLKSRNDTLLQVAQCIVEAQRGFLDYGDEAMQPLVLRDVSSQLDIHESTVSRATANKFMQTPRGIFELKYFFSSQVRTTDGGNASSTAIQAMVKRLIDSENPQKPLSDNKLAELLGRDAGIRVARRTVAKYREALGIAPTPQRRRKAST